MSTAPMAAIRPVNSSHWRTDLVTTWTASTSGGGDDGASAWPLLQAVITKAMTTMAMAERPARSDASKPWRYGMSALLTGSDLELKLTSTSKSARGSFMRRRPAADELINIREMCERSSAPASTLRYYERLGLITSERETSGSRRRYSEATLHRIIYITLAQRAGFSLEEIAEQLAILPNIHPLPPKVWEPLRKKWKRRIDQHIAELKQLKIDLKRCERDASR